MKAILDLLDYQDFSSLCVTLALLVFVAHNLAANRPKVFLWSNRLSVAAMLAHATLLWIDKSPSSASAVTGLIFRSMVTAAFALNISKIVLSAISCLYSFTMEPAGASLRRRRQDVRLQAERLQRERDDAARRIEQQAEWERQAPARELARREAEERARQTQVDKTRREASRLECEIYYNTHAPELRDRFSADDYERFVKNHMHDGLIPDEVESRARQLMGIIRQHLEKVEPPPRFRSIEDLATWYQQQKTQADMLSDERHRRTVLAQLNAQYAEFTSNLLSDV